MFRSTKTTTESSIHYIKSSLVPPHNLYIMSFQPNSFKKTINALGSTLEKTCILSWTFRKGLDQQIPTRKMALKKFKNVTNKKKHVQRKLENGKSEK